MEHPHIPNISNLGGAHPIPGGIRRTTQIPSQAIPWPSTLAGHKPPPPQKDPNLLGDFHPRGEPLAEVRPAAAHPTHPGGGEIYATTERAPMRRELLRSAPHPHAFPPRGKPLAKFGPAAAHPTQPGGGNIYPPTGQAPEIWESLRMPTRPHNFPPRGEPLENWDSGRPPHAPGGRQDIYPNWLDARAPGVVEDASPSARFPP